MKTNPAGTCLYCGRWWTERAGGVDKNGHCRECRGKIEVKEIKEQAE